VRARAQQHAEAFAQRLSRYLAFICVLLQEEEDGGSADDMDKQRLVHHTPSCFYPWQPTFPSKPPDTYSNMPHEVLHERLGIMGLFPQLPDHMPFKKQVVHYKVWNTDLINTDRGLFEALSQDTMDKHVGQLSHYFGFLCRHEHVPLGNVALQLATNATFLNNYFGFLLAKGISEQHFTNVTAVMRRVLQYLKMTDPLVLPDPRGPNNDTPSIAAAKAHKVRLLYFMH
jgi:hypothetical protein